MNTTTKYLELSAFQAGFKAGLAQRGNIIDGEAWCRMCWHSYQEIPQQLQLDLETPE